MPSIGSWKKLQAASGLTFGCFLIGHLVCHYSLSFGWDIAIGNLHRFRAVYQHPIVEVGLLLATVLHMVSNTVIILNRGKVDAKVKKDGGQEPAAGSLELKGHRYTGFFLSFAIFGHVGATRIASLFILRDPSEYDYSFLVKANELVPMNVFHTYIALFGMAGGWHLIYGTRSALATLKGSSVFGKPFPLMLKPLALLNHILIISAVLALSGYYYKVDTTSKAVLHDQINKKLGLR
jgi:hypothetical protein